MLARITMVALLLAVVGCTTARHECPPEWECNSPDPAVNSKSCCPDNVDTQ